MAQVGDASVINGAKVRLDTGFNPQSLQPRPSSQQPRNFQAQPFSSAGQVASIGGMKSTSSAILEAGSH